MLNFLGHADATRRSARAGKVTARYKPPRKDALKCDVKHNAPTTGTAKPASKARVRKVPVLAAAAGGGGAAGGSTFVGGNLPPPAERALMWKRKCAFMKLVKAQDRSVVETLIMPPNDYHEAFQCHMLMVHNVGVLHGLLLQMIRENHKGIWPQTPHPTWAVYSILRYNGFIEQDHIEPNAPCGDMMWFKRYAYTHQRHYDAEEQTRLSEHDVVALAARN